MGTLFPNCIPVMWSMVTRTLTPACSPPNPKSTYLIFPCATCFDAIFWRISGLAAPIPVFCVRCSWCLHCCVCVKLESLVWGNCGFLEYKSTQPPQILVCCPPFVMSGSEGDHIEREIVVVCQFWSLLCWVVNDARVSSLSARYALLRTNSLKGLSLILVWMFTKQVWKCFLELIASYLLDRGAIPTWSAWFYLKTWSHVWFMVSNKLCVFVRTGFRDMVRLAWTWIWQCKLSKSGLHCTYSISLSYFCFCFHIILIWLEIVKEWLSYLHPLPTIDTLHMLWWSMISQSGWLLLICMNLEGPLQRHHHWVCFGS